MHKPSVNPSDGGLIKHQGLGGWQPRTVAEGLEYVALGAIGIIPLSVSRRYSRAGVTTVRLEGGPKVEVAVAWREPVKRRVIEALVDCARTVAHERPSVSAVS